jgi:hypothetical protein
MGWWDQHSGNWQMALVAQVGGVVGFGAGLFCFAFKSPDLPVKPIFLGIAGGVGEGGSIGSALSIPYSAIIKQLIDPKTPVNVEGAMYSNLDIVEQNIGDGVSCDNINHSRLLIGQATASAAVVGVQVVALSCSISHFLIGTDRPLFTCGLNIPNSLPALGQAVEDAPQAQGGLGLGFFWLRRHHAIHRLRIMLWWPPYFWLCHG